MSEFDEAVGLISSLSKRVIAEEGHHSNPEEAIPVATDIFGKPINLTAEAEFYADKLRRLPPEQWDSFLDFSITAKTLKPETITWIKEESKHLATTLPNPPAVPKALPAKAEELGSPGIVLDEARARATPCSCFIYKGKDLCWSRGVLGMLKQEQEDIYCVAGKAYKAQPKLVERYTRFAAAAEEAHKKIEAMPKGKERLEVWLTEMSKELSKRAIEV